MVPAIVGAMPILFSNDMSRPTPGLPAAPKLDGSESTMSGPMDVIEMASTALVRNFEMVRRRTDVYTQLDRSEYLLLRTLDQLGPLDIYGLASALGLDPSTAGRQIAVMHRKGLVKRNPDMADRRRSVISATAKGHRHMTATRGRLRDVLSELLDGWAPDDLRTLGDMFTRFNQAVADRYASS
jgi:DNA-binding MarR family transcriptional regulator